MANIILDSKPRTASDCPFYKSRNGLFGLGECGVKPNRDGDYSTCFCQVDGFNFSRCPYCKAKEE